MAEPLAGPRGRVAVVTAGTSDLPVAEEARETLLWMGIDVKMVFDVGVAGPHRLRERLNELENADAVVVVRRHGRRAAERRWRIRRLPGDRGADQRRLWRNLGGFAALLSMLNSCAANVSVVNIDAGFKGAYVAGLIASRLTPVAPCARARGDEPHTPEPPDLPRLPPRKPDSHKGSFGLRAAGRRLARHGRLDLALGHGRAAQRRRPGASGYASGVSADGRVVRAEPDDARAAGRCARPRCRRRVDDSQRRLAARHGRRLWSRLRPLARSDRARRMALPRREAADGR